MPPLPSAELAASRETPERILDAAERLFGERGVAGTSLRSVTAAAGVNVAAIHYHFGSKESLVRAVLERHVGPINRERLERLDALLGEAEAPSLESLLEAFLAPALDAVRANPELRRVSAILFSEPFEIQRRLVTELFGEVGQRFSAALERVLPQLGHGEIQLRFHFVLGTMLHVVSGASEIPVAPGPALPKSSPRRQLERMVCFLAAGLRTGAPSREEP
jgi:AcrR family transcriptional regulator